MQHNFKYDIPQWFWSPHYTYVTPDSHGKTVRGKERVKQAAPLQLIPNVLQSFSESALFTIHDQPRSDTAKLDIFLFNAVAFRTRIGHPDRFTYGSLIHYAIDKGYEKEAISSAIHRLLQRKAFHVHGRHITCYPLLGLPTSYVATYKADFAKWKKNETASASTSLAVSSTTTPSLSKRMNTPAFIKDPKYLIPSKAEGQIMWRRPQMPSYNIAQEVRRHELLRIHPEPESDAGKQTIHLFNSVAFGSHAFADVPNVDFFKSNAVSYSKLVRCGHVRQISQTRVEEIVLHLLDSSVFHVIPKRREYFLSASKFLDDIDLIEPPEEPIVERDLYAELEKRPDELVGIRTPAFMLVPEYRLPPPPFGLSIWSYSKPSGTPDDASSYFDADSLARIHPDVTSTLGSICLLIFNLVAFTNNYSYAKLVRRMFEAKVAFELFTDAIKDMLQRGALTVRERCGSIECSAYPLLCEARMIDENQSVRAESAKMASAAAMRIRYQLQKKRIAPETVELHKRQRRASRSQAIFPRDVPIRMGSYTHCTGINGNPCTFGPEGGPIAVDPERWQESFSWKYVTSDVARRIYQCKACQCTEHRLRRQRVFMFTNASRHFHPSIGIAVWRSWLNQMLANAPGCALCGGEFVMQQTNHPWQPSFNILFPARGVLCNSYQDATAFGNIVHHACNMAQNRSTFDEFQNICRFIAQHAALGVENERIPLALRYKHFATVSSTARDVHNFTTEDAREICQQTLFQRDLLTGITQGYGPEFAIDLSRNDVPYLLLPSFDRINCDKSDPNIDQKSNHRVIPRLFNFLTKNFRDKDAVVKLWLERIIAKYKHDK